MQKTFGLITGMERETQRGSKNSIRKLGKSRIRMSDGECLCHTRSESFKEETEDSDKNWG